MKHCLSIRLLLLLLVLSLLSGCYTTPTPTEIINHSETTTQAPEPEEAFAKKGIHYKDNVFCASSVGVYPSEDGRGFYIANSMKYYDIAQKNAFPLCSVAGCQHRDESCPTHLKGLVSFLAACDSWYVICDDEHTISLLEIDSVTAERRTVYQWQKIAGELDYCLNVAYYSQGYIYVQLFVNNANSLLLQAVRLSDGKLLTFSGDRSMESGEFVGAFGNQVMIEMTCFSKPLPSLEEYLLDHPDADSEMYYNYMNEFYEKNATSEIRVYDLETLQYSDITTILQDGRSETPNLHLSAGRRCFDQFVLYSLGNTICTYHLDSGEVQQHITVSHLTSAKMIDGYLMYWTNTDNGLEIYLRDLDSGKEMRLENEGNTEYHVFSIHQETADAFIGLYDGKSAWIAKEDYYTQHYDRVNYYARGI